MFQDRAEAARLLAARLRRLQGQRPPVRPLVLAIPRGAVPMAKIVADELDADLDVVLVRKLGAPGNPELAVGSVSETGELYLDRRTCDWLALSPEYVERERQAQLDRLRQRRASYTPIHAPIDPAGRVVIVVDDGVATGATMIAALRAVRAQGTQRVIAAVGVAPPETVRRLRSYADEVVAVETPLGFMAVGQFFADFRQVSDGEVAEILREVRRKEAREEASGRS